jgi:aspartate carbamoyltransferase regulatory subunit
MSSLGRMLVEKISDGTVIDHIPAGRALSVLRLLGDPHEKGVRVALVINVASSRTGKKDILKVEGVELSDSQVQRLGLIAPHATVNIVRNYQVLEKKSAAPPEELTGVLRCTNPTCISVKEKEFVTPMLLRSRADPIAYRCKYCGRDVTEHDIAAQLA